MRVLFTIAALLGLTLAGCGRSDEDAVTDYCRGRLACVVDPGTSPTALAACKTEYLSPTGTPQEQCLKTAKAVCVGNCYHAHGCGVFYQNDPCSCDLEGYDCPE